jgi:hypothetical protein
MTAPLPRYARLLLKLLSAPFPDRVANEELGDALERIARLGRRRGLRYLAEATAILLSTTFGMAWNTMRELRARWAGRPWRRVR